MAFCAGVPCALTEDQVDLGRLVQPHRVAAARAGSRVEAAAFLRHAAAAASRLGEDGNHVWTAFGPTNVASHRVCVAAELGDLRGAAEQGVAVPIEAMPRERQVRHRLEVARALSRLRKRDEALTIVLQAERDAPEQVRRHFLTHELVHQWTRDTRRMDPLVAELARRLGHAA